MLLAVLDPGYFSGLGRSFKLKNSGMDQKTNVILALRKDDIWEADKSAN